jgi:hypothetical protein
MKREDRPGGAASDQRPTTVAAPDDGMPYRAPAAFLAAAIPPALAARALARIEAEHDELGASYLWMSLARLVRELEEEAEDLPAWSALLAARLERDVEHASTVRRARALLTAITHRGAEADQLIGELRRLLLAAEPPA